MLFSSLGQGYIFLLIFGVGCVFAGAEIFIYTLFCKCKNYTKNHKNTLNSTKNYKNLQETTKNYKNLHKTTQINKNQHDCTTLDNSVQKTTKNYCSLQKYSEHHKNLQNSTKNYTKIQKSTNHHKNQQFCTKLYKNLHNFTKNYLKFLWQFLVGFGRVCVYFSVILAIVFAVDYGNLRVYHILAFLLGFCAIKTIFAKRNNFANSVI